MLSVSEMLLLALTALPGQPRSPCGLGLGQQTSSRVSCPKSKDFKDVVGDLQLHVEFNRFEELTRLVPTE